MGKITRVTLISFSLLFLFQADLTYAGDRKNENYVLAKVGAYFPQHDDMKSFDTGFNGEIFYGRYFHKNFASELGAGYFKSSGQTESFTQTKDFTVKTADILYSIKGIYPIGILELFAGPGIGAYFTKVNATYTSKSPLTGSTAFETEWDTAFGFHVLAGMNINISPDWFLGVEGKYFWAKTKDFLPPEASPFGLHLDGIDATASLGWRF